MRFKTITPYILWACTAVLSPRGASAQNISQNQNSAYTVSDKNLALATTSVEYNYNPELILTEKAENLCDIYMDNMLTSQQKLAPYVGTRKYRSAVRQELPGAPVGLHCVYGQYMQLQRAMNETGDTLTIIPQDARTACVSFKKNMRKQYANTPKCIFEGRMFPNDSAYNAALARYLKTHRVNTDTLSAQRQKYETQFARNNFCITSVEPGAMLIVPRTWGSKSNFHMIMFVGRGYVQGNEFIPDENGEYVFSAHNSEKIGYLFKTWDTSNVFAANTKQIIKSQYAKELARIDAMSHDELVDFIATDMTQADILQETPGHILRKMAYDKYFQKYLPKQNAQPALWQIGHSTNPVSMLINKFDMQHTI